ncbi:Prefoldin subunit 4 [Geodia barretti]|uniref:Prefoldin subunit 4 n=1 Tax=Geodia barretti TaxID=519541 RepID=A0AA35WY05_GEOBA|nr:Prefoldin subunit 4 [Geodia barretti]
MTAPSTKEGVKDVEVEKEDQMRINLFARKNARLLDIREKITEKEKELQNLEDASDELMMGDSDIPVPYPHIMIPRIVCGAMIYSLPTEVAP